MNYFETEAGKLERDLEKIQYDLNKSLADWATNLIAQSIEALAQADERVSKLDISEDERNEHLELVRGMILKEVARKAIEGQKKATQQLF